MSKKKKILGIIPARSGSKGLPNKNIIDLNGKPLIYYTINEAKKVSFFDRILVSTDCLKIKKICESFEIEIPFLRPSALAKDGTRTIDVVLHVLQTLKEMFDEEYDYIFLLQPTSPLRSSEDILSCMNIVEDKKECSVISLTKVHDPHPYKMKVIKNNFVYPFLEGTDSTAPRQELPEIYSPNGAIYIVDVKTVIKSKTFFHKETYPYIMSANNSVNIDRPVDLELAKILMTKNNSVK